VPGVGFEPTSPFGQWCLRPPRLPGFANPAGEAKGTGFTMPFPHGANCSNLLDNYRWQD
jgi:hypothetical protein